MKRFICLVLSVILAFGAVAAFAQEGGTEKVKICILQIIDHPALNEAYSGIIASLDEGGWGRRRY